MYEEFLRQAREFDQSLWGGLFRFLIGAVFVASYCFFQPIQNWRLWLAILGLTIAAGWTAYLFLYGQPLFASLLALMVLAGVARTITIEIQRKRKRQKA